ncbi:MAG: class I SAM-dependent methyltransferase [Pseudomonadota bacterium]
MHPNEILEAYSRGENVIEWLRKASGAISNTEEIIETSYDIRTGSYDTTLQKPETWSFKRDYGLALASEIEALTIPKSVLEAGVGEGKTMSFLKNSFEVQPDYLHGFDISWSRIAACRKWLDSHGPNNIFLSVARLRHAPYADSSFDIVYTSHAIEPNGGKERSILAELFRITSRYLILLEPGYEMATEASRQRMKKLGYCTGLVRHATDLGMKVVKHAMFPFTENPLNPTAITVIEKNEGAPTVIPRLVCPNYGTPLVDYPDSLYSAAALRAYPKLLGIPCLRREDGIIASSYEKYL